ncbi:FAD/NAD(P)-binding domain-containing protein [Mycena galopus ATCC 62051]|nr:FAD/NAD(P)-binding domain-containing protein [Mycena galopus ATCC 62051]
MKTDGSDICAQYDVIVVGGGPVGLATALECSKAGQKVLVLEQYILYNQSGSSGDLVRMYRTAYTEDFMAKLAKQSMSAWNELEKEAGEPLRLMTGLLNFGDPEYKAGPEGTLYGPIPNLDYEGLTYTRLDRDKIQAQYPFQNLPDNWKGLEMPDNGCINVPLLLRTLHRLCHAHDVHFHEYATVKKIQSKDLPHTTWTVEGDMSDERGSSGLTRRFAFTADKIAITSGAYVNHILYPSFNFSLDINIWEMTSAYFALDSSVQFPRMWFHFADDDANTKESNLFYGFPSVPWGPPNLCRIAVDAARNVIADPDYRSSAVISPDDLANTCNWIHQHVRGVGSNPVPIFAGTCLQTNVADNMFVLDFVPDRYVPQGSEKSIVVFTAGWAMKFIPLLGRALKGLLLDGRAPEYNLENFAIDRKAEGKPIIRDEPAAQKNVITGGVLSLGSSLPRLR